MEMQPHSEPDILPHEGVLLAVDFGTKRIGIAVSDRNQQFSSPLQNHQRQGAQGDLRFFQRVIDDYQPVGILVGLPVHMSGDESKKSREARSFGRWLHKATELPVGFFDERYTTAHAEGLLFQADLSGAQRQSRKDMLAAQVLLQNFLSARERKRVDGE